MEGLLIVVSGPSGAGKGTVLKKVLEEDKNVCVSVSCTTRDPRPGEEDGVHYYFKTKEEFKELIKRGEFLEYAEVHGQYYGTPLFAVDKMRREGKDVLLEIDVQGALEVRRKVADAILIFIAPPSMEELKFRLEGRHTETPEQIATRLANAYKEMEFRPQYDHVVVNVIVDETAQEISEIIASEHEKKGDYML